MWVVLSFMSAFTLGFYEVFKKRSLNTNDVIPVLFFATFSGTMIFLPLMIVSRLFPDFAHHYFWFMPPVGVKGQLFFLLKSVIVLTSWIFNYYALKNLPLTIVSPIRASAPIVTLIGAMILFNEYLNHVQWIGVSLALIFYYFYSRTGKEEGIDFRRNKWVIYMIFSSVVGSISSLYDRYLVDHFPRMTMQFYYNLYITLFLLPFLIYWWYKHEKETSINLKLTIFLIGLFLAISDFAYFYAMSFNGSLLAVVSVIRRGSILIPFIVGAIYYQEKNIKRKSILLFFILAGLIVLGLGGYLEKVFF